MVVPEWKTQPGKLLRYIYLSGHNDVGGTGRILRALVVPEWHTQPGKLVRQIPGRHEVGAQVGFSELWSFLNGTPSQAISLDRHLSDRHDVGGTGRIFLKLMVVTE